MKLRIKGNSIRLRLSKTDVKNFCSEGVLEENTSFAKSVFTYAIETTPTKEISADFINNKITVYIPEHLTENWDTNDIVGFYWEMDVDDTEELKIIVEKDFQCLDESTEDQSDNFENPNKECNPD